jgi:hypothetical protein
MSATVSVGLIRIVHRNELADGAATQLISDARHEIGGVGGFVLVDAAPPAVKSQLDVFGEPRSDFAIMRRLKQQFDPYGTLVPGRFAGRL